jgi:hypothetical protein
MSFGFSLGELLIVDEGARKGAKPSILAIGYCSLLFRGKTTSLPLPDEQYSRANTQRAGFPERANSFRVYVDALSLIVVQMRRAGGARGGVGVNHME